MGLKLNTKGNSMYTATYIVYGDGSVVVNSTLKPDSSLNSLLRVGMRLQMTPGFENMTWYGRGPSDSYWDRKVGYDVGVYESTVSEQFTNFQHTQETGNKTDVRWMALTNGDGAGLLFDAGDMALEMSALHNTQEDLATAKHPYALKGTENTVVTIDYHQMGLGSASCGPATLSQYMLPTSQTYSYTYRILPISAEDDYMDLSKTDLSDVNAERFQAFVGIDLSEGKNPSSTIVFQVLGDGKELYTSPNITTYGTGYAVDVDVTGVTTLTLTATASGSNGHGQTVWGDAKLKISDGETPEVKPTLELADDAQGVLSEVEGVGKVLSGVPVGATLKDITDLFVPVKNGTLEFMESTGGSLEEDDTPMVTGYVVILRVDGTETDRLSLSLVGDLVPDGLLDNSDLQLVRETIVGKQTLDGLTLLAADADGNGTVDAYDLMAIKRLMN